ncbi:MAG: NepR family anti-sigma factor [Sphingobium sp.]
MDSGDSGNDPAPASDVKRGTARKGKSAPREDAQLSKVLRSVYQTAVKEEIPSEMLDLLRKLD